MKTIQLEVSDDLYLLLESLTKDTKTLILNAVEKYIIERQSNNIKRQLIYGYKNSAKEGKKISDEFKFADSDIDDGY